MQPAPAPHARLFPDIMVSPTRKIRIIGGTWRSRQIELTPAPGMRPTPDRVRETLFNWLGQRLDDLACLDLFAGSGILGFEAASRSAATVTLIEREPRVFATLQHNAALLEGKTEKSARKLELYRGDAVEFLGSTAKKFDVIFVDPPYRQGWIERVAPLLDRVLEPDGWIYAEAETPLTDLAGRQTLKQGRAGQVHFHLMRRMQA
ncbi:methyltransferase [Betaproteobacteria bacterium]|nr:methyltransferase [Betaproteobacteria bacterium]GHU22910.1 methyltransferase [Betaproteobacteria bacterium]